MGLRWVLVAFGDATLDLIEADPPLVWRALEPNNPKKYLDEVLRQSVRGRGVFARLFGGRRRDEGPAPPVPDLPVTGIEGEFKDLDKAAEGLHFLLTHAAPADKRRLLGFLQEGGAPTGHVEVSYTDPAYMFRSRETRQIAAALHALPRAALETAFNRPAMKNLYPFGEDGPTTEDLAYLLGYFDVMTQFLERLVTHDMGFLRYLS